MHYEISLAHLFAKTSSSKINFAEKIAFLLSTGEEVRVVSEAEPATVKTNRR